MFSGLNTSPRWSVVVLGGISLSYIVSGLDNRPALGSIALVILFAFAMLEYWVWRWHQRAVLTRLSLTNLTMVRDVLDAVADGYGFEAEEAENVKP